MPEIQTPDPGRKLAERYNLLGGSITPFLSPELVPVVILDDLSEEAPGPRFAQAGGTSAGVVARFEGSRLQNSATSGVRMEQFRLSISSDTTTAFLLGEGGPGFAAGIVPQWQEQGFAGTPAAVIEIGDAASGATAVIAAGTLLANVQVTLEMPNVILVPGTQLSLSLVTADVALRLHWQWAERDL